jgi:hypothetical protein
MSIDELIRLAKAGVALQGGDLVATLEIVKEAASKRSQLKNSAGTQNAPRW